jgi:hypothetical protein
VITTFISNSDRIPWDGLKQACSFLGMLIYTIMILNAAEAMNFYNYPLEEGQVADETVQASFMWLVIE